MPGRLCTEKDVWNVTKEPVGKHPKRRRGRARPVRVVCVATDRSDIQFWQIPDDFHGFQRYGNDALYQLQRVFRVVYSMDRPSLAISLIGGVINRFCICLLVVYTYK